MGKEVPQGIFVIRCGFFVQDCQAEKQQRDICLGP